MKTTITAETDLSPSFLAKVFWGMDSDQQAEFFLSLYEEVQRSNEAGETWMSSDEWAVMQWQGMRRSITKMPMPQRLQAANMIRAVAADFFLYTAGLDVERLPHEVKQCHT